VTGEQGLPREHRLCDALQSPGYSSVLGEGMVFVSYAFNSSYYIIFYLKKPIRIMR